MVDLILRGSLSGRRTGFLHRGRVSLTMLQTVRVLTFSPFVSPYRHTIEPGYHGLVPFNLRRGRLEAHLVVGKRNLLLTSSPSIILSNGRITLETGTLPGGGSLLEFAFWPTGTSDPRDTYVETATNGASGAVAQPYSRVHGVFVPHPKARYLGVGGKFFAMPNTGTHRHQYVKKVQLQKAHYGGESFPTKYQKAREVQVQVDAERINWSVNPGFSIGTDSWSGLTRVAFTSAVSGNAGQVSIANAASSVVTHAIPTVRNGYDYVMNVKIHATAPVVVKPSLAGASLTGAEEVVATPAGVMMRLRFKATSVGPVTITFTAGPATAATVLTFYDMLVEQGQEFAKSRLYFDGSSSGDAIWEKDKTVGNSRSYLYKNRAERYAAIKRILETNVPMGIGIAEPVFGLLPVNLEVSNEVLDDVAFYGDGTYGDDVYGG